MSVRSIGTRLLLLVPVVLIVSVATFLLVELLPGDPAIAILGDTATPDQIAAVREKLGLDESGVVRYLDWLGNAVTGDLGTSIRSERPVWDDIRDRLPVTIQLAVMVELFALVVAVPVGTWAGYRAGSSFDRATRMASFAFVSLPSFVLGLLLVYLLALRVELLPVAGWVDFGDGAGANIRHAILPALSLALAEIAVYTQLLRTDVATTLQEDFVLAAKAKGLPTSRVLFRHALRPSSFSLVTLAGVNLGRLIGGTVIVEQLFGLPGVGRLIVQSIPSKDIPVVQGAVLFLAATYLLVNLLVDVLYSLLDPRVRRATV